MATPGSSAISEMSISITAIINAMPSDRDVEEWFDRYAALAGNAPDGAVLPVALWIPIIGIPGNDY